MKQTIFLRTKQQQQSAINAILATPLDKDKPVTIRITDYKRNLDQNAKFHAMLADIARQVQWCGKWLKPEQWKVLLISGHAVATKQEADVLPGLEGEYVNIRESSAQMSVKRMASLIEYTTAWAVGQGVRFTDRRYE
ncbi:TPA: recombination protein NinB [Escherichia coli]|nr:recombination protein NinB [Escherichia coli]HBE5116697.1 recombination protein NinB [Escherichia coli]